MVDASVVHPWVADRGRIRFGVVLPGGVDWPVVHDRAQAAEDLGFDSVWLPDHPLMGWDSWTQLAAVAAVTTRIRLGAMVSCVYYRNPVLLARVVADVDRISGGRVILGLGSGDMQWEFEQMGLVYPPAKERAVLLEAALRIIPALLNGERVDADGATFSVRGARLDPPALQQPHVPVLVAGGGERTTLRLAAMYADASNMGAASWAGGAFTPEDAKRKLEVLHSHCQSAGRPDGAVLRTAQIGFTLAETSEQADAIRAQREANPAMRQMLDFLQGIPNFCTPAEAVARLTSWKLAGFEYFVGGLGASVEALEFFARNVMRPVVEASLSTA